MVFESAVQSCSYLGGKITLPKSESDFTVITEKIEAVNFHDICQHEIWIPIIRYPKNGLQWISLENLTSSLYLPWSLAEPNGESTNENCAIANAYGKNYMDVKCKEHHCFSCTFQDQAVFKLKGLPLLQLNLIDVDYTLLREPLYKGQFTFQGISGRTYITLNRTQNNWELKTFKEKITLGIMNNSKGFPIGLQNWVLKDNLLNGSIAVQLKLSKVSGIFRCLVQIMLKPVK
jgi:hypothetical protein